MSFFSFCSIKLNAKISDLKDGSLKSIQEFIWRIGYTDGEFNMPVYQDVARYLELWENAGIKLATYSLATVRFQKLSF